MKIVLDSGQEITVPHTMEVEIKNTVLEILFPGNSGSISRSSHKVKNVVNAMKGWTFQEDEALKMAYTLKNAFQKTKSFCEEFAQKVGRSSNSINARLCGLGIVKRKQSRSGWKRWTEDDDNNLIIAFRGRDTTESMSAFCKQYAKGVMRSKSSIYTRIIGLGLLSPSETRGF